MAKDFKEPHLLNASSNPLRLIKNLAGILSANEIQKIKDELDANVRLLYNLGRAHYEFASAIAAPHWRQRISRLYYGAYNVRRAVTLNLDGSFSTDTSDHQKIDQIPDNFNDHSTYKIVLKNLRDDRNLADYNHIAREVDLINSPDAYQTLVLSFCTDAREYLKQRGVKV